MKRASKLSGSDKLSMVGLVLAATGILLQVATGVAAVTVPVGAIVMLTLAILIFLRLWSWTTTLGALVGVFILIGAFIAPGLTKRLSTPDEFGPFIGTILQLTGLLTVIISGGVATVGRITRRNQLNDPATVDSRK